MCGCQLRKNGSMVCLIATLLKTPREFNIATFLAELWFKRPVYHVIWCTSIQRVMALVCSVFCVENFTFAFCDSCSDEHCVG